MVVRGEGEKHSLNAGASNTNSSLETAAWFAPPCPLFSLVNSSHAQQKGLSFLQGAEVKQKPLEIREGEGDLDSYCAAGRPGASHSQSGLKSLRGLRVHFAVFPRPLCPMGFSKQKYWSGLSLLSPRDLPDPGMEPGSPALQADSLPLSH